MRTNNSKKEKSFIRFKEKEPDETTKALVEYFDKLLERAKAHKEAKPFVEQQLKSGKLDVEETSGVPPAIVAKKIKQVEFVKGANLPKLPKKPALPKHPQQPHYTSPEEKANQEQFIKSKKKFDKKLAKAFSKWLVTDEDKLHLVE
jgi:hypothetical protein